MQLAQDLLRLAEDEEGWKLVNKVYEASGFNVFSYDGERLMVRPVVFSDGLKLIHKEL